jgi:hypothetical protein
MTGANHDFADDLEYHSTCGCSGGPTGKAKHNENPQKCCRCNEDLGDNDNLADNEDSQNDAYLDQETFLEDEDWLKHDECVNGDIHMTRGVTSSD